MPTTTGLVKKVLATFTEVSNRSAPTIAVAVGAAAAAGPPRMYTVLPGVSTRWISARVRGSIGPPDGVISSGAFLATASGVPASASGKSSERDSTTAPAVPLAGKLSLDTAIDVR